MSSRVWRATDVLAAPDTLFPQAVTGPRSVSRSESLANLLAPGGVAATAINRAAIPASPAFDRKQ